MNEQNALPSKPRPAAGSALAPLSRLRDEIDRLFEDFSFARPPRSLFALEGIPALNPAIELASTETGYELNVELPGLEEKDIDIEFADGVLTISGEKREESEKKDNGYLVSERRYGSFRRQLSLPADLDPETIDATFRNGVLKLTMKKDEQVTNRTKKIKIG